MIALFPCNIRTVSKKENSNLCFSNSDLQSLGERERERERKKGRKKERKKERKGGRRLGMDRMEISEEKLSKL